MTDRGLLLTITEPPPDMEEEFNAWYDEEHLPERLSIPGFLSARRWARDGRPGEGRYLATYELASAAVLASPAYLAFFEKPTPWTRRCLGKTVVFRRWACEQTEPGAGDPDPAAKAVALALAAAPPSLPAIPGALQTRRFVASAGEPAHIALVELSGEAALPAPLRVYRSMR